MPESAKKPWGQVARHVSYTPSLPVASCWMGKAPEASHEVHVVGPPLHVAHWAAQLRQSLSAKAYVPMGQSYVHVWSTTLKVPPARHDAHAMLPAPVQVAQSLWHTLQSLAAASAYLPDAQEATHPPPSK